MSDQGRASSIQLVAQDYAEIVAALRQAGEAKGQERRRSARMEVQAPVQVFPYHDGQLDAAFTSLTRDISFKGIGLLQGRPLARDSQFVIHLPRDGVEAPLKLLCSVMYCRELADGLFNVGASFQSIYKPGSPAASHPPAVAIPPSTEEMDRIRQSILG